MLLFSHLGSNLSQSMFWLAKNLRNGTNSPAHLGDRNRIALPGFRWRVGERLRRSFRRGGASVSTLTGIREAVLLELCTWCSTTVILMGVA